MRIGIDVGGTFADGIIIDKDQITDGIKKPASGDLSDSVLSVLDAFPSRKVTKADHLCISTTLITNLFANQLFDPIGAALLSGPGRDLHSLPLAFPWISIDAYADVTGNCHGSINPKIIRFKIKELLKNNIQGIAVVSKFSGRNSTLETKTAEIVRNEFPGIQLICGNNVWGGLNFPKRIAAACCTLAARNFVKRFFCHLKTAIVSRGIRCPLSLLKADGGLMPLEEVYQHPLETILSGPAASAMGCVALTEIGVSAAFVDIGGSTCDIGLMLNSEPLISTRGVRLLNMPLPLRAFAMVSLGIGGNSPVVLKNGVPILSANKITDPNLLEYSTPTLTAAARVLELHNKGSHENAVNSFKNLAEKLTLSEYEIARMAVSYFQRQITDSLHCIQSLWLQEPAYRIWELHQKTKQIPQDLIVLGAGGQLLANLLKPLCNGSVTVPADGDMANAIGAALARHTFSVTLRADTLKKEVVILEDNLRRPIKDPRSFKLPQARELAFDIGSQRGKNYGIDPEHLDLEEVYGEQFNRIRYGLDSQRIIEIRLVRKSGIQYDHAV
ncbi:hypothetical protein JW979_05635 [bacterium]|nr:hypothetical protein [candidate division CSSED10-310 bacterium]